MSCGTAAQHDNSTEGGESGSMCEYLVDSASTVVQNLLGRGGEEERIRFEHFA